MTVKELIHQLSQYPLDYKVVLSSDAEGNRYHYASSPIEPGKSYGNYEVDFSYNPVDSDSVCIYPE